MRDWALWYASVGFEVFPVHGAVKGSCLCRRPECHHPGKHPNTPNGLKDATCDINKVTAWWERYPDANIGIHCSNVTVLDVDGEVGKQSLRKLVVEHGDSIIQSTPRAETGGGGLHFFFNSVDLRNRVKFLPGLDIRTTGGFIVAPPSMHVSGRRYRWTVPINDAPRQDMPEWLVGLARDSGAFSVDENGERVRLKVDLENIGEILDGERNNRLTSIAGKLFQLGRSDAQVWSTMMAINEMNCKPPVPTQEIVGICDRLKRKDAAKRVSIWEW